LNRPVRHPDGTITESGPWTTLKKRMAAAPSAYK
jgi:hypothetical protein